MAGARSGKARRASAEAREPEIGRWEVKEPLHAWPAKRGGIGREVLLVTYPCRVSEHPHKTSELCAKERHGQAQARAEGRISKAQWRAWQLPWRSPNAGLAGRALMPWFN